MPCFNTFRGWDSSLPEHTLVATHRTCEAQSAMHATQLPRRDESRMMRLLNRIVADESGQDMIEYALIAALLGLSLATVLDRKSTRLNSSHRCISYAVF